MNLPNKLTILRVIMIPFFVAALLYDGGANQNMRFCCFGSHYQNTGYAHDLWD